MSDFSQGLLVSIVGLIVTFTALGVFILVMIVLQKIFAPKSQSAPADVGSEIESEEVMDLIKAEEAAGENEELVAAITAIVRLRNQQSGRLGSALVSGPGPYWTNH